MKKTKFLSALTAIVMCFCAMLSSFSVSAADNNDKKYTLEELFAMSKEEFFALKSNEYTTGEDLYNLFEDYALQHLEYYQNEYNKDCMYLSADFMRLLEDEDENKIYTANITEMEIQKLVGDAAKCEIGSPISLDSKFLMENGIFYGNILYVVFPEYESLEETTTLPEEKALKIAKCWFCVNQVIEMGYNSVLYDLSPSYNEKVIDGDVNFDKKFDLYDVIWIAKSLINEFELTEAQVIVADTNGDGVADLHDAINLAKKLME